MAVQKSEGRMRVTAERHWWRRTLVVARSTSEDGGVECRWFGRWRGLYHRHRRGKRRGLAGGWQRTRDGVSTPV
ncbi:uncharacterized protein M6B38_197480 [Iris pallida]|uniref:Uncharacterized protein n=1 Tax=Iris pallida TaxID=29817 RepID=A0AAX6EBV6_IRIPA|nr:uncharacterized protein M6B38_197480 [Iris pallida]